VCSTSDLDVLRTFQLCALDIVLLALFFPAEKIAEVWLLWQMDVLFTCSSMESSYAQDTAVDSCEVSGDFFQYYR